MRIVHSILIVLVLACGVLSGSTPANGRERVTTVEPVDDPLLLPYRFQLDYSLTSGRQTEIVPADFDRDGDWEAYHVQSNRTSINRVSSVIFHNCLGCGSVSEQYNYDESRITETATCDLDGDGRLEVVVLFIARDTLYVEIISPVRGPIFRTSLSSGTDRNGDGVWDGFGYFVDCEDVTGDSIKELLLAVDVGFDYYPRELICLDWTKDARVWDFEVAGIVAYRQVILTRDPEDGELLIVFGIASKGNPVAANGMDDSQSYLICLNERGEQLWRRQTGDVFTNPIPVPIRYDDDAYPEILYVSSRRADTLNAFGDTIEVREWSLVVSDLSGRTVDSIAIDGDHRVRGLSFFEDGFNREPCVVFDLSDDTLRVYSEKLVPLAKTAYVAGINVHEFHDFVGDKTTQIFAATTDGKLWLFDHQMQPLAQFAGPINPNGLRIIPAGSGGDAVPARLIVYAEQRTANYVFRVVPTPWYTVFYRNPLLAAAASAVPFGLIIAVIGIAMVRGRRKSRVINQQRDQLALALDELHAAQDKLVEAEKSQLTHDIAGGVAHEIRNALDPAVQCLGALQDELPESEERFASMLDLSRQSVTRAISMTRLVKEFSDLAAAHRDEVTPVRAAFDDIVDRYQPQIDDLKIGISADIPEDLTIACAKDHADILLGNLIGNAVEALAEVEERTLEIAGSVRDGVATIRITDSGPGISETDRGRIFNAFFSTKPTKGMGLGLTFCRRIAQIYGGSLTLADNQGGGATFVVQLPASKPTMASEATT